MTTINKLPQFTSSSTAVNIVIPVVDLKDNITKQMSLSQLVTRAKGDAGPIGPRGLSGFPGNQGPSGPQGLASTISGPQGTAGPSGPQGFQGLASTVSGPSGPSGARGPSGPQGAASTASGPSGPQGSQGAASTIRGPSGPQGPGSIAPGPQGSSGPSGPQGAASTVSGPSGPAGSRNFTVTNSGASDYIIDGANDPSITLLRGFTYTFTVSASGHPFWIKTAQVTGTGSAYSTGVTNNGTQSGTITFAVPYNAPSTLYYICQFHGSMVGTINIADVGPSGPSGPQGPVTIATNSTIAYSTSTGVAGALSYDTNYLYVCVATNTWIKLGNTATNITSW